MELADALYPCFTIQQAGIFYHGYVCVGYVSGLAACRIGNEHWHAFDCCCHAWTAVVAHHRPAVFEITGQGRVAVAQRYMLDAMPCE
jgi:hypothetical protein